MIAYAAEGAHVVAAKSALARIQIAILFPLMDLMIAVALLVFCYGIYEYVSNGDNDEARSLGQKHMLYGIIGFIIMLSALAILTIATGTFGVDIPS